MAISGRVPGYAGGRPRKLRTYLRGANRPARKGRAVGKPAYNKTTNATTTKRVGVKFGARMPSKTKLKGEVVTTNIGTNSWAKTPIHRYPRNIAQVIKATNSIWYSDNVAYRYTGTVGSQAVNSPFGIYTSADLTTLKSYSNTQLSETTTGNKVQDIFLVECYAEMMITNQELYPCHLQIFDCVARRDLDSANYDTPGNAWYYGLADAIGTNAIGYPGGQPFSSQVFTNNFKVLRVTDVNMTQGHIHTHKVKYKTNRLLHGEEIYQITQNDSNNAGVRGLTFWTMIVQHGFPLNDNTTKTQVSLGATALDVVVKRQFEVKFLTPWRRQITNTQNLPTSFTVAGEGVDIGSGAITNDAQA